MARPRLVIGIGSGRCGTKSLARLLNRQFGAVVTHEIKPVLAWKDPESRARIAERIAALRHNGRQRELTGDVAHYYLNYVEDALGLAPQLRVICLKRPREQVVESYFRWVTQRAGPQVNHWVRAGKRWRNLPDWSKCFPKYETDDMKAAIGLYWDDYYSIVDRLQEKYADNLRVFDMHTVLNTGRGQQELLSHVGIPEKRQRIFTGEVFNANS